MKIGFYCSGGATRVTKLLDFVLKCEIFMHISDYISFIYIDNMYHSHIDDICECYSIQLIRKDISSLNKQTKNRSVSEDLLYYMENIDTDYLFVFGNRFLDGEILDKYKWKIINLHPSILPAFQGYRAIDKAREYGCFIFGNTAHFVEKEIDTGPIIMQNICVSESLNEYDTVLDKQIPMVLQIMTWLEEGRIKIDGRRVRVAGARYELGEYIPNLELSIKNCFSK